MAIGHGRAELLNFWGDGMRRWIAGTLIAVLLLCFAQPSRVFGGEADADLGITAQACVLMEADTGQIIYEKNSTQRLSPASITKIMTLILIFEALEDGKITLQDEVTTSAYAKSMGGSQVFLEEGEKQTVETLIKCIVVASGNDASVAMAEYICGSEQEFVRQMNEKAAQLGMEDTHFTDCCGLTDSQDHYTSAKDVAVMSRELSVKYPQIHNYSSIWMEDITHVTSQGTSTFTLANTNKLLRQYEGCNGLKTGSTSLAKYCLSATAVRDDIELIAVIMAAPDYKVRFSEAAALLNYGFSHCTLYKGISLCRWRMSRLKMAFQTVWDVPGESSLPIFPHQRKIWDRSPGNFSRTRNLKRRFVPGILWDRWFII